MSMQWCQVTWEEFGKITVKSGWVSVDSMYKARVEYHLLAVVCIFLRAGTRTIFVNCYVLQACEADMFTHSQLKQTRGQQEGLVNHSIFLLLIHRKINTITAIINIFIINLT